MRIMESITKLVSFEFFVESIMFVKTIYNDFRFTSPHPKDFPDEVLHLISERPNICKQIHLPAQSGSTEVLNRMRRGYSREAYLDLVQHIRSIIPNIAFSSDFIAGFCGETEEEFNETLSLIEEVRYSMAYLFAYSMREVRS